ncbi:MAG TPA: hypothetical protein VK826_17855, partial [Bacteroidia bacterium]|nr:hypothetical protein [Bacteroidia bacterium]
MRTTKHVLHQGKRSLLSAFLVLVLMLIAQCVNAQTDTATTEDAPEHVITGGTPEPETKEENTVRRDEPVRWLLVEKSFGVVPEIDFINGSMGLALCRGKFIRGTPRSIAGNGYYVGFAYDTEHKISFASFGGWIGLFKKKLGGQIGLRGLYYVNSSTQVFAIRPEAGIGFVKAQLSYGYNIVTEKTEFDMPTHTLTLSVYFA